MSNPKTKTWFRITNKADQTAVIDLFDIIGSYGITSVDFTRAFRALPPGITSVTLNINSPGGDCSDGFTMFDTIKAAGVPVKARIVGVAASMASVVMLAADTIEIAENGRVMIHRVSGGASGNADDVDAAAQVIRQFEDRIVALYVARTGKSEDEIRSLMKAEAGTWFFGQEAVDAGFVDSVVTGTKAKGFRAEWAQMFTTLPAALFDNLILETAQPTNKTMIETNKARLRELSALDTRTAEQAAEFTTLQAEAATAGYDLSTCPVALAAQVQALRAQVAAKDKAEADALAARQKAEAEANDPAKLRARVEVLEAVLRSGVLARAGGIQAIEGAQPDGSAKSMKMAAFNALSSEKRMGFIRAGGTLVQD